MPAEFRLKVCRFEAVCQFELNWGESQCITVRHVYPPTLDHRYHDWQQSYLNFYQTRPVAAQPSFTQPAQPAQPMRAHRVQSGSLQPPVDWQTPLIDAETALLLEFRDWLCQGALHDIRKVLTEAARSPNAQPDAQVEVFLTCEPELVRLPWENWQISDDLNALSKIRLVRVPSSIRNSPVAKRDRWKRVRILAICCDDAGLNLTQEKQTLKSLEPLVSVQIIGWGSAQTAEPTAQAISQSANALPANALRQQILTAITDPTGWDMLFFAGHSDETQATSGMLAIAPNCYITVEELKPYLMIAKNQGLQLALFNSCSGLQIAAALIDLGLNEVIVMRERIHSTVAQTFLVQFALCLKDYKDAHTAMLAAIQHLFDYRSDYPSAYLVPSLFRRPAVASFQLSPPSWRQTLDWLRPKRREGIALLLCLCLCVMPWLQTELLDRRELVQAWYRQLTHQALGQPDDPGLALVRIDDASIQADRQNEQMMGSSVFPVSQQYIGRLVAALAEQNVKVIGIDYVIDDPDPRGAEHTQYLSQIVQRAVQQDIRFVFAKILNPNSSIWMQSLPQLTHGSIEAPAIRALGDNFHMPLQSNFDPSLELPFSAQLSGLHRAQATGENMLPHQPKYRLSLSEWLDALAGQFSLYPMWFHAVTDFSIPPEQIYREIPAWQLLESGAKQLNLPLTAIITAGGYPEAGIAQTENGIGYIENFTPPQAIQHWYSRQPENRYRQMTGGEHLGYLFHHFLHQHFVLPVPNLLMVLLAAAVAKLILWQQSRQAQNQAPIQMQQSTRFNNFNNLIYLAAGTVLYILLSLQLYVSSATILLPIVLPLLLFWLYLLPKVSQQPVKHQSVKH